MSVFRSLASCKFEKEEKAKKKRTKTESVHTVCARALTRSRSIKAIYTWVLVTQSYLLLFFLIFVFFCYRSLKYDLRLCADIEWFISLHSLFDFVERNAAEFEFRCKWRTAKLEPHRAANRPNRKWGGTRWETRRCGPNERQIAKATKTNGMQYRKNSIKNKKPPNRNALEHTRIIKRWPISLATAVTAVVAPSVVVVVFVALHTELRCTVL